MKIIVIESIAEYNNNRCCTLDNLSEANSCTQKSVCASLQATKGGTRAKAMPKESDFTQESLGSKQRAVDIIKDCPRLWMKADSALLKNQKPFFIPDFTCECSAGVYLALRVSRLGKSIAARFSHRYYDALSVVVDFTAEDVLRRLREAGEPWDIAKSFDSSVALGDFVDATAFDASSDITITLTINGGEKSSARIEAVGDFAGQAIEAVSRFFTIRQGDIILIGHPNKKPLVQIDDHLVGYLNGKPLLEFNIK